MADKEAFSLGQLLNQIEPKWQKHWDDNQCFKAANPGEPGSEKPKFYCLDMFPYPSGEGLHMGHPIGYTATDILSRYKRMKGFNVLHPMGWDAFGLPAEQYAIKMGVSPQTTTQKNIDNFRRQLKLLGFSYDWSREISTIDPSYYRWTQWLFKRLYEKGLAYQAEMAVNWCPALGTVLANDEVIDGKSERGGHPVERRPMRQWVLRITQYAERLLNDLQLVDWPESTKEHQRNWIGKSEGARVRFKLELAKEKSIEVFTTRPDTLLGVSFIALAPEHPLIPICLSADKKTEVENYIKTAANKTDLQRTDLSKEKSGVFTGAFAVHPITQEKIPVWVADYVLATYGTGSIMGVPAHDDRDKEFANKFKLSIKPVVDEENSFMLEQFVGGAQLKGKTLSEGTAAILDALKSVGSGESHVTYKLRDWLFARQRYWGEPIPVLHREPSAGSTEIRLLDDSDLPLKLPEVSQYAPTGTGESPLAAISSWVDVERKDTSGKSIKFKRETNTMPGSAGSSWYFLRFMDPNNSKEAWSNEAEKYWGPVDFYLGGSEHAVGHLLYSRFWNKVFFDLGLVTHTEPFKRLFHQGMLLAEDGEKMSKSRGNVVGPDEIIREYGADTLRCYVMFLGPLDKAKPWQTKNIEGTYRFLARAWRICVGEDYKLAPHIDPKNPPMSEELDRELNKCIKQVGEDIENISFNTALSALMILTNTAQAGVSKGEKIPLAFVEKFALLLAPFAPHLAEEIWSISGHTQSLSRQPWPAFDPSKLTKTTFQLAIQVNGKLRDSVEIEKSMDEAKIKVFVLNLDSIKKWTDGKEPKKFIYVKEKLVSIVI